MEEDYTGDKIAFRLSSKDIEDISNNKICHVHKVRVGLAAAFDKKYDDKVINIKLSDVEFGRIKRGLILEFDKVRVGIDLNDE